MAFSCVSCRASRPLIRSACAAIEITSHFHRNLRNTRSVSIWTYQPWSVVSLSRKRPSFESISQRKPFCSKIVNKQEPARAQVKVETRSESLLQGLTEEERQVLNELEAEERRFREKSDQDSQDYHLWEGSFEDFSKLSSSVSEGHVPFQNRQRIIQDVIEEMWNPLPKVEEEPREPTYYPRGKTGVFDIGELVDLLRDEKAEEAVVITIPQEFDYADYMLIVTVRNNRHLMALAEFIRKRFKQKDLKPTDILPVYNRSAKTNGWIALDLGNIILHMFLQDTRDHYDLETLWTVGPLFDDLTNAKDSEIVQLLNTIS